MSKEVNTGGTDSLRYLEAHAVECAAGTLGELSLFSQDDEALGVINGVLIDPGTRQLRYFVVGSARPFSRRRYLVRADTPAVVLPEIRGLRMETPSDGIEPQRFDSRLVPRFSDEDLLTAMFSTPTP